jgi:two-component system KDP operon response regulator KdpE
VNTEVARPPNTVLLIDDEPQIHNLLTLTLETNGFLVTSAHTGQEGVATAAKRRHDLIILDLGLPDLSGLLVLKQLREWTQTPVIILTVQDEGAEKIAALDSGADDYITKPFDTGELLARLRAAIRRTSRGKDEEPVFRGGGLTVDFNSRQVARDGQPVKLTATEFALLRLFIQNAGKVLTHRHILHEVWGLDYRERTQYLRVYMTRLREKLEANPAEPALFLTEQGVGYRFVDN